MPETPPITLLFNFALNSINFVTDGIKVTILCTPQAAGDGAYDGTTIKPGMWISNNAYAYRIVEIKNAGVYSAELKIIDVDNYNYILNPDHGPDNYGNGYIFYVINTKFFWLGQFESI